jgi:hypothetical protein
MRGKTSEHHHAAHMKNRAKGGRLKVDGVEAYQGGGDRAVEEEAEEKKHGGRAKHHPKRAKGGHVEGHKPKHHMGRKAPGRKRGGRVGADTAPLTSAHGTTSPEPQPKTQEGGLSK